MQRTIRTLKKSTIQARLAEMNQTQTGLARHLGYHQAYISQLINGAPASMGIIEKISSALNITPHEIYTISEVGGRPVVPFERPSNNPTAVPFGETGFSCPREPNETDEDYRQRRAETRIEAGLSPWEG